MVMHNSNKAVIYLQNNHYTLGVDKIYTTTVNYNMLYIEFWKNIFSRDSIYTSIVCLVLCFTRRIKLKKFTKQFNGILTNRILIILDKNKNYTRIVSGHISLKGTSNFAYKTLARLRCFLFSFQLFMLFFLQYFERIYTNGFHY